MFSHEGTRRDTKEKVIIPTAAKWFDAIQLAILIAISPWFFFPKPRSWWVLLLIPLLWLARKIAVKRFVVPTPMNVPLFIFLAAVVVSIARVRAADFSHNLPKIAGVIFAIALFYAMVAFVKSGKLLQWAIALFLLGGFGFSLIGLLGMPTFKVKHLNLLMKIKDKIPQVNFGLPGAELGFSTNAVGGTLLLVIPLFLTLTAASWLYRREKEPVPGRWIGILLGAGLIITGGVLLLTQSRGAWAGLFISAIITGLFTMAVPPGLNKSFCGGSRAPRRGEPIKVVRGVDKISTMENILSLIGRPCHGLFSKRAPLFLLVLIGFLVLALLVGAGVYAMTRSDQLKPGIKQAEGTFLFRVQLWDLALPIAKANPWFGIGLSNFRKEPEVRYFLSSAHNQFLHIAVELGIPALAAYLAILLLMGFMCVRIWKNSGITWMRWSVLGLGWGQLAFVFFGLFDAVPPGAKVGIMFWLSAALITAIYRLMINEQEVGAGISNSKERIMKLAGAWKDMNEKDYRDFIDDIYERREKS